jgi:hypothetical protein
MNDRLWPPTPDPTGPASCRACGCRLIEEQRGDETVWRHFPSLHVGQDARGCRPGCVDAEHDRYGFAIAYETAAA